MTNIPELRRLHGAATQGEWRQREGVDEYIDAGRTTVAYLLTYNGTDAAAIVAIHNAAPALFDAADRLARITRAKCRACDDSGWVCETHTDRPWEISDHPEACGCGPGAPCPCCRWDMATQHIRERSDKLARVEAVLGSEEAVERVARGLATIRGYDDDDITADGLSPMWECFVPEARAAIAALAGLVEER